MRIDQTAQAVSGLGAPTRIVVAGNLGAGKTRLSLEIARRLNLDYVELDALFFGEGGKERPTFLTTLSAFVEGDAWVTEWDFWRAPQFLADRATVFVWLDLGHALVVARAFNRSRRTRKLGVVYEPPLHTMLTNRDHIVWESLRLHRPSRRLAVKFVRDRPGIRVVHLRSRREVRAFASALETLFPGEGTEGPTAGADHNG